MLKRIDWIDCWKGIAIIILLLSNILDFTYSKYIFWFHIPLLFYISGYLYKEQNEYLSFFKKKFSHLIIPYISFLVLFSIPDFVNYIGEIWQTQQLYSWNKLLLFILKQLYGGQFLNEHCMVFWFITCLFTTQQIYNLIYTKFGDYKWLINIIILDIYCLAMIDCLFFKDLSFPWNINVVLMAIPFYWLGHLSATRINILNCNKLLYISLLALTSIVTIDNSKTLEIVFDMRVKSYGIPILNIVLAIAGIVITQKVAQAVIKIDFIEKILREIGISSMILMYLYQPVLISLKQITFFNQAIVKLIAILVISYLIYKVIINFPLTRKLFLGDFQKTSNIKLKALSKV